MESIKEETIKFSIKSNGLFKILQPVFEGDELYDSELLENIVITLIEKGERNIIIDLSNVDYLYSDSINTFIDLNHRMINVWGRIALLSPNQNLLQILRRSGVEKFLIIYVNEHELFKATKKIIQQTTSLNVQKIQEQGQDTMENLISSNHEEEAEDKVSKNTLKFSESTINELKSVIVHTFKVQLDEFSKAVINPLSQKIDHLEDKLHRLEEKFSSVQSSENNQVKDRKKTTEVKEKHQQKSSSILDEFIVSDNLDTTTSKKSKKTNTSKKNNSNKKDELIIDDTFLQVDFSKDEDIFIDNTQNKSDTQKS